MRLILGAFVFLIALSLFGQNEVTLQIVHRMGVYPFAFNTQTSNNLGEPVSFDRIEYYISNITLLHDDGKETMLTDQYILMNGGDNSKHSLGVLDVEHLEGIRFSIGVDATVNHNDPTEWPSEHALAPKNPSMHWGWNAGYRFIAIEGKAGENFNQKFELHGLGDENYFTQTVRVIRSPKSGKIDIALRANYAKVLEDLSVSGGVVSHGAIEEAKQGLENFRDNVFVGVGVSGVHNEIPKTTFEIYPIPSEGAISITHAYHIPVNCEIYSTSGALIQYHEVEPNVRSDIELPTGVFFIQLRAQNGAVIGSERIVVL